MNVSLNWSGSLLPEIKLKKNLVLIIFLKYGGQMSEVPFFPRGKSPRVITSRGKCPGGKSPTPAIGTSAFATLYSDSGLCCTKQQ